MAPPLRECDYGNIPPRMKDESDPRVADLEQQLKRAKQELTALRRESPSVAVLRSSFAHRVGTLRARLAAAARSPDDDVLRRTSNAYGAVLAEQSAKPSSMLRTTLDGLTWWHPEGTVEDQRFPYRVILQTREVAVGGIMLDLGAHVGRMAIPRVILGDAWRAYCAEPDPVTYACLARNVLDNGLRGVVLPDQTAISDRDGTVPLLRQGSPGNFRVVSNARGGRTIDVPCCTLDTWVARLEIDLDAVTFVKVDVEGFERRLLAGATRVLSRRHIAWQMEIKPAGLRAAGDDPRELYAELARTFTHFVDLNRRAAGKRVRPVAELPDALQYIEPDAKTDVLVFCADV